jgi:hypothetical protein
LGILGLLAQGARSAARNRSRLEFQRTYRELAAIETPPLVSANAPVRQLLLDELHRALTDAAPDDWSIADVEGLIVVSDPHGPKLLVEVEPPGCISRRGRCDEALSRAVPSYWVIAPVGPTITVLELVDGEYVERARVTGEVFAATEPIAVTVPLQAG